MATFGVEGIRYFSHLRASGEVADAPDLTTCFNICNGFDSALRRRGAYAPVSIGRTATSGKTDLP